MKKSIVYILVSILFFGLGWFTNELNHFVNAMKQDKVGDYNIRNLEYHPIVIPKSSNIKLGEEYIADVRLAVVNTYNPPIVIIGKFDSLTLNSPGDTLKYDAKSQASTFRETPTTVGKHIWEGKIINADSKPPYKALFHIEYTVTQ